MFQEASPFLLFNHGKPMTMIKFPVFIRACGSIESCLFVAYFLVMFPTAVSYFQPTGVEETSGKKLRLKKL